MADVTITQVPITVTVSQGGIQGPAGPSGSWTGSHTGDASITGSLTVTEAITAASFTGSLSGSFEGHFVSGTLGTGIEIVPGSTILRSAGFKGLTEASNNTGPGGFVIYSGSNSTYLSNDQLVGTGFKFVGTSGSSYITFTDQDGGDFTIKTDKFTLQNNGNITASNAIFSGTARANNFVEAQATVIGPGTDETYSTANLDRYIVGDYANQPGAILYLDGTQGGEIVTNVDIVSIDVTDPIYISDIKVKDETSLTNEKINITLRNNASSAVPVLFNITTPKGTGYSSSMAPGNIYDMEVSFGSNPGSENKTITGLRATDLSLPVTASAGGINISGSLNVTDININGLTISRGSGNFIDNIAIGSGSLASNTTGVGSIAIGTNTLSNQTTANYNVAIGYKALESTVNGDRNTAIGRQALTDNTSGDRNTALGQRAMESNLTGHDNTAIGDRALLSNLSGNDNIAVGTAAMRLATGSIYNNIAIGNNSMGDIESSISNIAIGYSSSVNLSDTTGSIGIGDYTLLNATGNYNVALGYEAMGSGSGDGSRNTAIGRRALRDNVGGDRNTAIGQRSMEENISGNDNTAIGDRTLLFNKSGKSNIAIGTEAMLNASSSRLNYNIAIGASSLRNATGSIIEDNIIIGYSSSAALIGFSNTTVGNNTLKDSVSTFYTVAIGDRAMYSANSSQYNTAVGYNTFYNLNDELTDGGKYNVALGSNAGALMALNSDASSTTPLKYATGSIFIGYNAYASGSTALAENLHSDNEIVIGYKTIGNGSNSVTLGNEDITKTVLKGNVGIGTTAPLASLHVYDVSGSIIAPTSSGAPTFDGTDGQFVFGTDGGNHYIYTWMAGAWRSGSLS